MKNPKIKMVTTVLIVVLVLTIGVTALANNLNNENFIRYSRKLGISQEYNKHDGYMKYILDELVEEGKITQNKADTILEYIEKRVKEKKEMNKQKRKYNKKRLSLRINILQELEEKGIITNEEAQAIREKQKELRDKKLTRFLNKLVDNGIIEEQDVGKIRVYIENKREEKRKELEKIKNMTVEEKREHFKNHKKRKIDIIDQMIQDKIITEEQGEKIRKILPRKKFKKHKCRPRGKKQ
ncbi:hypothetical protein [Thermohalobacter berrensis]|uniref:CARD domain-containing protein n=1 Tax=Thermohalobacter berrensis TaxID=99594 RepID=A0A419SW84_9FIRM|nr:hypothetical protein [Thermohalobacter berrensis]RKD29487.1 hypothetical protein BET03_05355 [Thermohalobacter berrensis]